MLNILKFMTEKYKTSLFAEEEYLINKDGSYFSRLSFRGCIKRNRPSVYTKMFCLTKRQIDRIGDQIVTMNSGFHYMLVNWLYTLSHSCS